MAGHNAALESAQRYAATMTDVSISLGSRLVLASAALALGWEFMGLTGVVLCSPVAGACLARPIFEQLTSLYAGTRAAAYRKLQGRYYAFRGVPLDIVEDVRGQRWLRTAEVRNLIASFPRDGVLRHVCPEGLRPEQDTDRPGLRIRADTLDHLLAASRQLATLKFRNWLQREVIFPAHRGRERSRWRSQR